jgi:hypothetical protein
MDAAQPVTLDFSIASPDARMQIDVRLRGDGDRWVAIASARGASNTAIAPSARQAFAAALGFLPEATVRLLLADVALYGPSAELVRRGTRSA